MTARSIGDVLANRETPKARRSGQPVWRNSYYEGQIEDRIWRPFAGGNRRGAKRRIGAIMKSARELERRTRRERQKAQPGTRNGVLGQIGLDVLDALYNRFLDYRTGRLDPAIASIAEAVGHSYAAVHAALNRLRKAGFVHWIRRSRPKKNPDPFGPQVEQIPNAYVPVLPPAIEKMVAHLLGRAPIPEDERWRREQQQSEWNAMLAGLSRHELLKAIWDGPQLAGETLARIARLLDERESSTARETRGV